MMKIYGYTVDNVGRCKHYHGENDIISIKFKCCNKYYPCFKCHEESENHKMLPWPQEEFDQYAILCGNCKKELTINEYLNNGKCIYCHSGFNPNCSLHYHIYFDIPKHSPTN